MPQRIYFWKSNLSWFSNCWLTFISSTYSSSSMSSIGVLVSSSSLSIYFSIFDSNSGPGQCVILGIISNSSSLLSFLSQSVSSVLFLCLQQIRNVYNRIIKLPTAILVINPMTHACWLSFSSAVEQDYCSFP